MEFKIQYHPDVKSVDLPKIDTRTKSTIKRAIEQRLATQPEIFGNPLRRTLKGYWKSRVGDYRIVFDISGETVRILAIIHRKDVYQKAEKRVKR
jgi:mRNA interferase RelE/StbE